MEQKKAREGAPPISCCVSVMPMCCVCVLRRCFASMPPSSCVVLIDPHDAHSNTQQVTIA